MHRVVRVIVGLVLGFAVVVVVGRWVSSDSRPVVSDGVDVQNSFPALEHDPAAALELVGAWRTWRTATFIVDGTWTRTLDSGGPPLSGPVHVVQDPPRRIVQRLGATVEVLDGTVASCEPVAEDQASVAPCLAGNTGMSYDQRTDSELDLVGSYVGGDTRIYDVEFGLLPGCYRVELTATVLGSPWGRWAEFCFDDETGALISSRVRRKSAVDVELDVVTSSVVVEADFTAR